MVSPRRHISLTTKLAAALLTIRRPGENGELVPVISFEEAQKLTAEQIISRFEFQHGPIPHAFDGPAEPWNLEPLPKAEHREVTARIDIPRIAKARRISKAEQEFRNRMLAKREPDAEGSDGYRGATRKPKAKIQSRPFPKLRRGFEQKRGER